MCLARSGPAVGPAHDRLPIRRACKRHLRHPAKSGSTREIPVHHAVESRDVEGAEADDREPFRTIVVELAHAQWKREHEELKY